MQKDSDHLAVPIETSTDPSLELAGYLFENDGGKGYTSFNPINEWSGGRTDGIAVYKLYSQTAPPNGKAVLLRPAEVKESRSGANVERVWNEFWKEIVTDKNGQVDVELLKLELADFSMLLGWVPRVYDHVTGGMISKPHTWPSVVCSMADDHLNRVVDDMVADAVSAAQEPVIREGFWDVYEQANHKNIYVTVFNSLEADSYRGSGFHVVEQTSTKGRT